METGGASHRACRGQCGRLHYFEIERHEVEYMMDTCPIVRREEQNQFGEYRIKRLTLEAYDQMAAAKRTGQP